MSERSSPNELPKKCPWIMRIGVFFDGTGNNKNNDKEIKTVDGQVIKANEMSNIAKLYEFYKLDKNGEKLVEYKREYRNGVGTVNDEDKELGGLVKGEEGIERVHEMIKKVADFFDSRPCAKEFIVDVFGFSRGAALARHFVNELHDRAAGPNVKVGFVGLYDTVASFALSWRGALGMDEDKIGDNINRYEVSEYQGQIKVKRGRRTKERPYYAEMIKDYNFNLSAASADRVEHFVAKNEVRKNFPLSSVKPADGERVKEQIFIGVHSDIGGGYGPKAEYTNKLEWIARNRYDHGRPLSMRRSDKARGAYRRVERFTKEEVALIKQKYQAQGYTIEEKDELDKVWLVGKKTVDNELAKVYLHLMHERAKEAGVPFHALPDKPIYQIPKAKTETGEYNPKYCAALDEYKTAVLNNRPISDEIAREIYTNHVHQSDVDSEDRASILNVSQFFVDLGNKPAPNHIRTIFDNDSSKAVDPEENDDVYAVGAAINRDNLSSRDLDKLKNGG